VGLRAEKPEELDGVIAEMIATDEPVIADIRVEQTENCLPMVPSGAPHNEMILSTLDDAGAPRVTDAGLALV
jgi:acetolactate synthase-1/2/3 large subunit